MTKPSPLRRLLALLPLALSLLFPLTVAAADTSEAPVYEADIAIPTEYNPPDYKYPPFAPNFTPKGMGVAPDCRSLTIGNVHYVFSFRRMGCWKAGVLAQKQYASGVAPGGYACRHRAGGMLCWRRGQPQKYLEWRLPGTKPSQPRG